MYFGTACIIVHLYRSAALDGAGLYAATIHDVDMALKVNNLYLISNFTKLIFFSSKYFMTKKKNDSRKSILF